MGGPNLADDNIALMAHLMRRAGFGAPRHELETRSVKGYEATVEELLNPEDQPAVDKYELLRYHPWAWKPGTMSNPGSASWMYHMVTTQRPLQEKVTLFWHQVFATGNSKVDHWDEIADMIDMFREEGMGKFRDLLLNLSKNPAMIFWLDNNENHGESLNENWGRELLELFSLGVGNYTETDVKEASRAFTGWTFDHKLPRFPYGRFDWDFLYRWNDHDANKKEFLGHGGLFNGEDIIDIIAEQTATAKFICRHLYNFFVADEPPVPTWPYTAPRDPEAISSLTNTFVQSDGSISDVLRTLFNSVFFKNAMFARVKSPTEVVVGTMRLVGGAEFPILGYGELSRQPGYMGQEPLNPPTVEGWHTGNEWVNSASLMSRINFVTDMLGDTNRPGVQTIIATLSSMGELSPGAFVDAVLEQMGSIQISRSARSELIEHAEHEGSLIPDSSKKSGRRVSEMLQLVSAVRDYQFG
ncbi:MAG: DUF1800 domain-containing protein [SAR202 cluster bacterium]|nr:DUF1800 domain-containing protein [SAR202 cluster bacterium]